MPSSIIHEDESGSLSINDTERSARFPWLTGVPDVASRSLFQEDESLLLAKNADRLRIICQMFISLHYVLYVRV